MAFCWPSSEFYIRKYVVEYENMMILYCLQVAFFCKKRLKIAHLRVSLMVYVNCFSFTIYIFHHFFLHKNKSSLTLKISCPFMSCHNIPCIAHRSMVGPLINYGKTVPKSWKEQIFFYKMYMMKKATFIFFFWKIRFRG